MSELRICRILAEPRHAPSLALIPLKRYGFDDRRSSKTIGTTERSQRDLRARVGRMDSTIDLVALWGAAQTAMDQMPEGTTLHSAIPSQDGSRAVCIWESDSVETVRNLVEDTVGQVSTNEYFPVDDKQAIGLPGAVSASGVTT